MREAGKGIDLERLKEGNSGRSPSPETLQQRSAHHMTRHRRLQKGQSSTKLRPVCRCFGGARLRVLRSWRKICLSSRSWLRAITLCQDVDGFWVAFVQVSPEGPDMIVYLPVTQILPVADALESVAGCNDKTYRFVPAPVFGKDYWNKPARVNGAAYMCATFRYRPVLVFNGTGGLWTAQLVSGRHARLVARLLRMLHQRYSEALAPN